MAVVDAILSAYKGPKEEMRAQINAGITEPQTLFYALMFGFLSFVAIVPSLARRAITDDIELKALAGAQFVSSVFMMPLLMYAIAGLSHLILLRFGGQGSYVDARRAMFWAAIVTTPCILLNGLINVYAPSFYLLSTGVTAIVFFWQWISCLFESEYADV